MKKIITTLLLLIAILTLVCGCNTNAENSNGNVNNENNFFEYLSEFLPGATEFEQVDISDKSLHSDILEVFRDVNGAGYVLKVETAGFNRGLVLMIGISSDGVVKSATCIQSNETFGTEKTYGESFMGKDVNSAKDVDTVAGSSMTTLAYKRAVINALEAVELLNQN